MRRLTLISLAALSLAACSNEATGPEGSDLFLGADVFGTEFTVTGGYEAAIFHDRLWNALPDEIALSDEQRASIRSLIQNFENATRADREALGAIIREARQAAAAGKPRSEVHAILARGAEIRARLFAAERKLKSDIEAVLTAEQKAWIAAHAPRGCRAGSFPPLSDAQKAQIRALETGFREDNRADLETLRAVHAEARAAAQAGKTREEIAAILAKGADAAQRLAAARRALHAQILAVLTPEQRSSGCLPLG